MINYWYEKVGEHQEKKGQEEKIRPYYAILKLGESVFEKSFITLSCITWNWFAFND